MANNSTNVKFGKPKATGAIYCAPANAQLPTSASAALSSSYKCLGYMNDSGLVENTQRDSGETKAWGGDVVARPQTAYGKSYKFNCIELNIDTLKAVYGDDNVEEVDGVITIKSNAKELTNHRWVFEVMLDANTILRKVVPFGKVTEFGEVSYVDDTPVTLPVTVSAFPDSNGDYEIAYMAAIEPETSSE